jgi:hypothetical protein
MRTTIELPDELFRQAKARAALSGISLKELITRWVAQGLQSRDGLSPAVRRVRPLPQIIPPSGRTMPALTNAEIEALLDTEDAGAGHVGPG